MEGSKASPRLREARPPKRDAAETVTRFVKGGTSLVTSIAGGVVSRARADVMRWSAGRQIRNQDGPVRLCLGSGHAPIPGWTNIDFEPPADLLLDLRYPLPWPDGSVTSIYSEHVVEHLPLENASSMYREWRRIIAPDGTVRIATPDLALLIEDYRGDWRARHDWVHWPEYANIDTPVRMINIAMRAWGHQYLYDYPELEQRLREAGFSDIRRVALGDSVDPALRLLESRADSTLIVEARP
jgi:predicted SAM-dependent methyltransferase